MSYCRKLFEKKEVLLLSLLGNILVGCSTNSANTQADYGAVGAPRSSSELVMPPGLTAPETNSEYRMLNNQQVNVGYTLNKIKDMQIVQGGAERYLSVKNKSVNQVWPMMIAYLNQQGFAIKFQNQAVGLIQTDWVARNTTVSEGGVRALFEWIGLGAQYSLDAKYMFRITIWQNGNDTQVFVTNYEMDEVYPGCSKNLNQSIKIQPSDAQATKWVPTPPNPQIELDFLMQFMAFAGLNPEEVKQIVAIAKATESAVPQAKFESNILIINDQFDRAWWRTGIALERVGLGVSDKNRSTGEYYVYPLQANIDNPDPGVFERWFGDDQTKLQLPKAVYTIKLEEKGAQTDLTFTLYPDAKDSSFDANRAKYLGALQNQLK